MTFPQDLARALDPAVVHCLVVLERCLHANLPLTEEQRQEVYDALTAVGWFKYKPAKYRRPPIVCSDGKVWTDEGGYR